MTAPIEPSDESIPSEIVDLARKLWAWLWVRTINLYTDREPPYLTTDDAPMDDCPALAQIESLLWDRERGLRAELAAVQLRLDNILHWEQSEACYVVEKQDHAKTKRTLDAKDHENAGLRADLRAAEFQAKALREALTELLEAYTEENGGDIPTSDSHPAHKARVVLAQAEKAFGADPNRCPTCPS